MTPYKTLRSQIEQGIRPENMSQLAFDYARKTLELDKIFNEITYEYCSSKCPTGNIGCCLTTDVSQIGLPEEFLFFQRLEASENGWKKSEEEKEGCCYHSSRGCKLSLFKSPMCINSLCDDLGDYIQKEFGESGRRFTDRMNIAYLFNQELLDTDQRVQMFKYMDLSIEQGKKLIEMKRKAGGKK